MVQIDWIKAKGTQKFQICRFALKIVLLDRRNTNFISIESTDRNRNVE